MDQIWYHRDGSSSEVVLLLMSLGLSQQGIIENIDIFFHGLGQ